MNAVEIEKAISDLAGQKFNPEECLIEFVERYRKTPADKTVYSK